MNSPVLTKFTDIDDIETNDIGSVYVINTTPASQRSQVSFVVAKVAGVGNDRVVVPAITLPIELTAQVTKKQLISSSEFRRAVALGFIQPITKEYYNDLMSRTPDAKRLVQDALSNIDRAPKEAKAQQVAEEEEDPHRGVSPRYVVLAEQLRAGEISERALIIDIRTNGDLTQNDARFLWKETKDSSFSALRNYLSDVRQQNNW